MGRRSGALAAIPKKAIEPSAARLAIAKHLKSLTDMRSVNMAQVRAQVHEEECIETLVEFMRNEALPPTFRRDCAIDIVKFARGAIRVWAHAGETIDAEEVGESGNTVGEEISAARNTAALYEQFNQLVMKGIHPDNWPERVR